MNDPMFTIEQYDLQQIAERGNGYIHVRVRGYWSTDPITITLRRELSFKPGSSSANSRWTFSVTHSAGGRDKGAESDDLAAETTFGMALIAAAEHAQQLRKRTPELEAWYVARRAAEAAAAAAEAAARAAAAEADAPLGALAADELIATAATQARTKPGTLVVIDLLPRGCDLKAREPITAQASRRGRVTLRDHFGNVLSRAVASVRLAAASHRSTLHRKEA